MENENDVNITPQMFEDNLMFYFDQKIGERVKSNTIEEKFVDNFIEILISKSGMKETDKIGLIGDTNTIKYVLTNMISEFLEYDITYLMNDINWQDKV